jgi:hypothetical protein
MTVPARPPRLYHAAPLHYLLRIVEDGALYAGGVLAARGIAPRATARRRDRMLGLADYVHLSPASRTPLLADKLRRGYPHALLVFGVAVLELPETGLLPYNAKSWRTRAALRPVTDPSEQACLWHRHLGTGRFPSLEVLVKYGLSLAHLEKIALLTAQEHSLLTVTLEALALDAPLTTEPALFPSPALYCPTTGDAIAAYFASCRAARSVLPPPPLPFD